MLKKISTVNKPRNSEDRVSSHHQNSTSTKHSSTFESMANHILNSPHHVKKHQQHEQIIKEDPQPDMNTCIIDNANRKQFTKFLRQLNPKLEHLLFFYMLISSVKTRAASTSLIGNDEIKKALKAAHKSYEEQKLGSFLSGDVREKMNDTLRKLVYNEAVFSTVEREVNDILEAYYPSFLNSAFYKTANSSNVPNKQKSFIQDETITSSKMIRPHERAPSFNYTGKQYMPINPYHAPSYPLHGSRQDSEVQSMVSMAYSEASTVHNTNRLSKLDPVMKKSLEANEHLKNAAANISTLTLEMSQMSMTGLSHPHAHQVAAEKRKHSIAQNTLAQSNCQEIARQIIEKLESYIRSFGKRVIYDESKRDKVAELPLPVHLRDSVPLYNEDDGQEVDAMMQPNMKVNHHGLKQSESVNQSNPEQKTNYQTYLFTFTSKENDIENLQLQQQQQQHQSQNHHHQHKKPSHIAALNLDSGISTKSADSLDRVQDWLDHTKVSATTLPNEASSHVITEKQPTMIQHSVPEKSAAKPAVAEKIPVVYKVPGEEQPYMSYFNGKTITLGQFKDLINKKGAYKYFFMNVCKLFEEETVLYEEITDENQIVPLFKGKVMAKIQSID